MKKLFFVLLMTLISFGAFANEDEYWVIKGGYGTETFGLGLAVEGKGEYFGIGLGGGTMHGAAGGSLYARLHAPIGGGSSVWFGMGAGTVAVLGSETYDGSGTYEESSRGLGGWYWLIGATFVNFNNSDEGFYIDGSFGQSYITDNLEDESEWVKDWVESLGPIPTAGLYIGYAMQS